MHDLCSRTHRSSLADCQDCPMGMYCSDRGAIEPIGPCKAGHICYLNALIIDPVYNDDPRDNKTIITYGDLCAAGYYCPEGTTSMQACPLGTYYPSTGATAESDCLPCDPGYYCNDTALSSVSGMASFCTVWNIIYIILFRSMRCWILLHWISISEYPS